MFVVGGLSGIFMAAVPVDIHIHDTYFIVAHFHYVLFGATVFGVFGAIHFWFPKMFGRMMNETVGKIHFVLSFIGFNCTFFPMHFLGTAGFPRRLADPYNYPYLEHLLPLNQFITYSAILMGGAQILLLGKFRLQHLPGPESGAQSVERQRARVDRPLSSGTRKFRHPAGRLPRPLRIRLAAGRRGLPPANAVPAEGRPPRGSVRKSALKSK